MKQTKRTKLEIQFQLLEICTQPTKPTIIMHKLNTCYHNLQKILKYLHNKELIDIYPNPYYKNHKRFLLVSTTTKGIQLLKLWNNLRRNLKNGL